MAGLRESLGIRLRSAMTALTMFCDLKSIYLCSSKHGLRKYTVLLGAVSSQEQIPS
jgi:hypothetical protein